MALFIGVDVGGTKVMASAVDARGRVLRTAHRSTPGRLVDPVVVEDALTEAVQEVAGRRAIDGVGLAAAGFVDGAGERVMFAPHLPWRGEQVRARLMERWGTTVVLDNDANCAARAEVAFGAARGATDAIVVTLGTGIGGAVVLNGRVHRGSNGMAGEFGHMQVVPDGQACECGGTGCWEQYCSGNALARHARAQLGRVPTLLDDLCDGDPARLVGPMVTQGADQGDRVALEAFASVGDWLGVGVANLVAAFDPDVVVIAGGVSAAGEHLLAPARAALARSLVGTGHRVVPPLLRATLGPEAGVVGAADKARSAVRSGGRRARALRRTTRVGGRAARRLGADD
ncbi:MAG TPA: ROK family protein [Nocardioides sp.]|uniref:ROK family protein n=1 Tax=Nocardioides sp. TaxID=35761 RepID=UPI002C7EDCF7|nr:ROK family protein [Nocardioides sp.]HTW15281.1 ROK family protein [Nocardioides sp.]